MQALKKDLLLRGHFHRRQRLTLSWRSRPLRGQVSVTEHSAGLLGLQVYLFSYHSCLTPLFTSFIKRAAVCSLLGL